MTSIDVVKNKASEKLLDGQSLNIKLENIIKSYDEFQTQKQEDKINEEVNKRFVIMKDNIYDELELKYKIELDDAKKKLKLKFVNEANNGVLSFIILMSVISTYSIRYYHAVFDLYFKNMNINLNDYVMDIPFTYDTSKYNLYEVSLLLITYHYCIFKIIEKRILFTFIFTLWILHVCSFYIHE